MISKFLVACSYICSYSQIINPGLSTLANLLRHGSIIYMTLVLSYYLQYQVLGVVEGCVIRKICLQEKIKFCPSGLFFLPKTPGQTGILCVLDILLQCTMRKYIKATKYWPSSWKEVPKM